MPPLDEKPASMEAKRGRRDAREIAMRPMPGSTDDQIETSTVDPAWTIS